MSQTTATREKALALLSRGISQTIVASTLGVTDSAISQLISDPLFKNELDSAKFTALKSHTDRSERLDALEDKLITRLEDSIPLMFRPMEILKTFQIVNSAKRVSALDSSAPTAVNQTVNLYMPTKVVNKFTTNINNQVVKVGGQELITIQSASLLDMVKQNESAVPQAIEMSN